MNEQNPYQSPKAEQQSSRKVKRRFDAGLITGRYLQVLGVISILNMVIGLLFFDRLIIDMTAAVLFWAAYYLIRHSPTARNWTLVICVFNLIALLLLTLIALLGGTESSTLTIGQTTLQNPPIVYVIALAIGIAILPGIPTWLLMTPEAKAEFGVDQSQ